MDFNMFYVFQYLILVILFDAQVLSPLGSGSPFQLVPVSFDMDLIAFDSFFCFLV